MDLAPEQVINGRYQVLRPLGRGSSATTFLAYDRLWDHPIALKLVHTQSPALENALRQEVDTLRKIRHPSLNPVHDFARIAGASDPRCFFTAEHVAGVPLQEATFTRWSELRKPFVDTLAALGVLHAMGLRHGDVKPDNIMVRPDGSGVLIDLGCARPFGPPHDDTIAGTPSYLAPELRQGQSADGRADLFALGLTLQRSLSSLELAPPKKALQLIERLTREAPTDRPADVDEALALLGAPNALPLRPIASLARIVGRGSMVDAANRYLCNLERHAAGPRCLMIQGAPGSGRTRLLRELTWIAQQRVDVVESRATRPHAISDLLAWALGRPTGPRDVSALVAAAGQLVARSQPLVLIIDDVHLLEDDQAALLRALVRVIDPADPVMIVGTTVTEPRELELGPEESVVPIRIGPLGFEDVVRWLAPDLSESGCRRLVSSTGGYPAAIHALFRQFGSIAALETALVSGQGRSPLAALLRSRLKKLGPHESEALAFLCASSELPSSDLLRELNVPASAWANLVDAGVVEPDDTGWKLVRASERAELEKLAGARNVASAHRTIAGWLDKRIANTDVDAATRSAWRARSVEHLLAAGQTREAAAASSKANADHLHAPAAWSRAVSKVATRCPDVALQVLAVRLDRRAGLTKRAAKAAERLLATPLAGGDRARVQLELAECYRALGRTDHAIALATEVLASKQVHLGAEAATSLARCQLKRGSYLEALQSVERALACQPPPDVEVDALECAGLVSSFLGRSDEAEAAIARVAGMVDSLEDPRRKTRALGTRGLIAFHRGDLAAAQRHYGQALTLAEQNGLADQVATAALNLGTALHQQGDLQGALEAYERGRLVALGLGQHTTHAVLQFDIAKALADLGRNDHALEAVDRCEALVRRTGLDMLTPACATVRAEVALARHEVPQAIELLQGALASFRGDGSVREQAEVLAQLAEASLVEGRTDAAAAHLDEAERVLGDTDARDVRLRLGVTRGHVNLASGRVRAALDGLERQEKEAAAAGMNELHAEIDQALGQAWIASGSAVLSEKHFRRARETWERSMARLPKSNRDAFRDHPRRKAVFDTVPMTAAAESVNRPSPRREQKLERLVELAKRINSSLDIKDVLDRAMDAAIELTGAERGFVLLTRPSGQPLEVAVARNLDRAQLEQDARREVSPLAFSRSIAERVVASEVPVITADAQLDPRFRTEASVHAMNLRSVVCLPVRAPEAVLGALYLDNRLSQGHFVEDDLTVLRAFADHVAIALTNARLHAELRSRTEELDEQKRKVEALARGQAEEIDRLQEQVRETTTERRQRYAYREIIGTSAAMKSMFDLLDRVVDTSLPVLIQGESGTGKELVARAVHQYGPRSNGPWVAINCGAVPENLLESELFGYVKGAFTGADRARAGLVEQASGGTLFLDEIGEMPLSTQVKLLRVLQEREVRPLGAAKPVKVDFRLLCATNRRLREQVGRGNFREDLYYRIAVVEVEVPPLRARTEDIRHLVGGILDRLARDTGQPPPAFTGQAMRKLVEYGWPGNVRQLENVVTRAAIVRSSEAIRTVDLDLPASQEPTEALVTRTDYRKRERDRIMAALEDNRWNVSRTARLLGIPRPTVYRRMKELLRKGS